MSLLTDNLASEFAYLSKELALSSTKSPEIREFLRKRAKNCAKTAISLAQKLLAKRAFPEAEAWLEKALEICRKVAFSQGNSKGTLHLCLVIHQEFANLHKLWEKPAKGRETLRKLLDSKEFLDFFSTKDAFFTGAEKLLLLCAEFCIAMGNYVESTEILLNCARFLESFLANAQILKEIAALFPENKEISKKKRLELAHCYACLSKSQRKLLKFADSVAFLEKSLGILKETLGESHVSFRKFSRKAANLRKRRDFFAGLERSLSEIKENPLKFEEIASKPLETPENSRFPEKSRRKLTIPSINIVKDAEKEEIAGLSEKIEEKRGYFFEKGFNSSKKPKKDANSETTRLKSSLQRDNFQAKSKNLSVSSSFLSAKLQANAGFSSKLQEIVKKTGKIARNAEISFLTARKTCENAEFSRRKLDFLLLPRPNSSRNSEKPVGERVSVRFSLKPSVNDSEIARNSQIFIHIPPNTGKNAEKSPHLTPTHKKTADLASPSDSFSKKMRGSARLRANTAKAKPKAASFREKKPQKPGNFKEIAGFPRRSTGFTRNSKKILTKAPSFDAKRSKDSFLSEKSAVFQEKPRKNTGDSNIELSDFIQECKRNPNLLPVPQNLEIFEANVRNNEKKVAILSKLREKLMGLRVFKALRSWLRFRKLGILPEYARNLRVFQENPDKTRENVEENVEKPGKLLKIVGKTRDFSSLTGVLRLSRAPLPWKSLENLRIATKNGALRLKNARTRQFLVESGVFIEISALLCVKSQVFPLKLQADAREIPENYLQTPYIYALWSVVLRDFPAKAGVSEEIAVVSWQNLDLSAQSMTFVDKNALVAVSRRLAFVQENLLAEIRKIVGRCITFCGGTLRKVRLKRERLRRFLSERREIVKEIACKFTVISPQLLSFLGFAREIAPEVAISRRVLREKPASLPGNLAKIAGICEFLRKNSEFQGFSSVSSNLSPINERKTQENGFELHLRRCEDEENSYFGRFRAQTLKAVGNCEKFKEKRKFSAENQEFLHEKASFSEEIAEKPRHLQEKRGNPEENREFRRHFPAYLFEEKPVNVAQSRVFLHEAEYNPFFRDEVLFVSNIKLKGLNFLQIIRINWPKSSKQPVFPDNFQLIIELSCLNPRKTGGFHEKKALKFPDFLEIFALQGFDFQRFLYLQGFTRAQKLEISRKSREILAFSRDLSLEFLKEKPSYSEKLGKTPVFQENSIENRENARESSWLLDFCKENAALRVMQHHNSLIFLRKTRYYFRAIASETYRISFSADFSWTNVSFYAPLQQKVLYFRSSSTEIVEKLALLLQNARQKRLQAVVAGSFLRIIGSFQGEKLIVAGNPGKTAQSLRKFFYVLHNPRIRRAYVTVSLAICENTGFFCEFLLRFAGSKTKQFVFRARKRDFSRFFGEIPEEIAQIREFFRVLLGLFAVKRGLLYSNLRVQRPMGRDLFEKGKDGLVETKSGAEVVFQGFRSVKVSKNREIARKVALFSVIRQEKLDLWNILLYFPSNCRTFVANFYKCDILRCREKTLEELFPRGTEDLEQAFFQANARNYQDFDRVFKENGENRADFGEFVQEKAEKSRFLQFCETKFWEKLVEKLQISQRNCLLLDNFQGILREVLLIDTLHVFPVEKSLYFESFLELSSKTVDFSCALSRDSLKNAVIYVRLTDLSRKTCQNFKFSLESLEKRLEIAVFSASALKTLAQKLKKLVETLILQGKPLDKAGLFAEKPEKCALVSGIQESRMEHLLGNRVVLAYKTVFSLKPPRVLGIFLDFRRKKVRFSVFANGKSLVLVNKIRFRDVEKCVPFFKDLMRVGALEEVGRRVFLLFKNKLFLHNFLGSARRN